MNSHSTFPNGAPSHLAKGYHRTGNGGAPETVLATIAVGQQPESFTYDSGNGFVYVANFNSNNVSIISGTSLVGTVQTGKLPRLGEYDPHNGYVYASNQGSANVSVISGKKLVGTDPAGLVPYSAVYNARFGWMYVPDYYSNTVTVISGMSTLTNIKVGVSPQAAAYDPATGDVYVANLNSNNVTVVTGFVQVATIPVGINPFALTSDGAVYVANERSNNVSVLVPGVNVTESLSVGIYPTSLVYDSANGYLYVANLHSNSVSVVSGTTVVATVPVGSYPTAMVYDPANGFVYVANQNSGNVSVLSGTSLEATILVGSAPVALAYDSGNGFIYVADAGSNNVSVIGIPPPSIASFVALPASIPLGGSTVLQVTVKNGSGSLTYLYAGLPPGCANANTSELVCTPSMAGSYSATVKVTDQLGRNTSKTASFAVVPRLPDEFPVTFSESGLSSGTNWSVTMAGSTTSSVSSSITFFEPNGTYGFIVGNVAGYSPTLGSGTVTVSGVPKSVAVTYVAIPGGSYSVRWTETGLSVGTNWSVTMGAVTRTSIGTTILFVEPNGSYPFTVGKLSGYSQNRSSGTVTVNGNPLTEGVTFTTVGEGGGSTTPGLSPVEIYAIVGGLVAALTVGGIALSYWRRRPPPAPDAPLPPPR